MTTIPAADIIRDRLCLVCARDGKRTLAGRQQQHDDRMGDLRRRLGVWSADTYRYLRDHRLREVGRWVDAEMGWGD